MNIQKIIRKWVGVLIAAASYFVIHEGAQAIFAIILIINAIVFIKYILPKYKKAFGG